jgi:hypothetical protein
MTEPVTPVFDKEKAKAAIQADIKLEKEVGKCRARLIAEADEVIPFTDSKGRSAHFYRIGYTTAVRLVLAQMPQIDVLACDQCEAKGVDKQGTKCSKCDGQGAVQRTPTPEEIAQIRWIQCQALAATNLEGLSAEQFDKLGKFVDESADYLWYLWGLSPKAADEIEFFRGHSGRPGLGRSLLRRIAALALRTKRPARP